MYSHFFTTSFVYILSLFVFFCQQLFISSRYFIIFIFVIYYIYPKGGNRFWPETTAYEGEII